MATKPAAGKPASKPASRSAGFSLKDIGYKVAVASDSINELGAQVLAHYPVMHDDEAVMTQVKQGLKPGIVLRWLENRKDDKAQAEAAITMDKTAFGKLKESDSEKHKLVGEFRTACSKYVNKITDRVIEAAKPASAKGPRVNKSPAEWIKDECDTAVKRAKLWSTRGSITKSQKTEIENWVASGLALAAKLN